MKVEILSKEGTKKIDLNRRKAIHEKCINCSCWSSYKVTKCKLNDCQLHPFRTGREKQNAKDRSMAIREYCMWCAADQHVEVVKCVGRYCPLFAYRLSTTDKSVEYA